MCAECGPMPGVPSRSNKKFGMACIVARRNTVEEKRKERRARRLKEASFRCSAPGCDYEIKHMSQLEIDHIDGDWHNNDPDNLQVLCCNCHRYKTYVLDKTP